MARKNPAQTTAQSTAEPTAAELEEELAAEGSKPEGERDEARIAELVAALDSTPPPPEPVAAEAAVGRAVLNEGDQAGEPGAGISWISRAEGEYAVDEETGKVTAAHPRD